MLGRVTNAAHTTTLLALVAAVLGACGGARPACTPSVAGGEAYCALLCAGEDASCPPDLPHRTDLLGAAVCRASDGPLPEPICDQLGGRCRRPPPLDPSPWRAPLAERGVTLEECDFGYGLRFAGTERAEAPTAEERRRLLALEGVTFAGIGRCCGSSEPCTTLMFQRGVTDPARLADGIAAALGRTEEDDGLRVSLEPVAPPPTPRCDPEDNPLCIPLRYEGCAYASYVPDAPRAPSPHELGGERGSCVHDGECVPNGGECVSFVHSQEPALLVEYLTEQPVFCGCIENACRWFVQ